MVDSAAARLSLRVCFGAAERHPISLPKSATRRRLSYGDELVSTGAMKRHLRAAEPLAASKKGNFLSANDNVEYALAA